MESVAQTGQVLRAAADFQAHHEQEPHKQSHTRTHTQTHHSHSNTQPGAYSPPTLPTSQHHQPTPLHGRCGGCQNCQFLSLAFPHFVPRESELAFQSMLAHVSTSPGSIAALARTFLSHSPISPHTNNHTRRSATGRGAALPTTAHRKQQENNTTQR